MNVLVLNGSPKGEYSITLQTVLLLQKKFPGDDFDVLHVGQRIKAYEADFSQVQPAFDKADVVLFEYPVYTFLVPSQLHRFIELLKRESIDMRGKFATQITTSKHFFDMTAHRFIEDNCHDLGLKVVHGLSADMEDLTEAQGRKDAVEFWNYLHYCVENDIYEPAHTGEVAQASEYAVTLLAAQPEVQRREGADKDTVIVADLNGGDARLEAMISDFRAAYPYSTRIVDISQYPFSGGCLGCFNCAGDGKCIYRDGFDSFLRESIQTADAIVYAFAIRDHSMGSRFKMYDDRQFCNGHRTVTEGKPLAYLVLGDYGSETNLQTVIEARSEVGHNFLAGVATDLSGIEAMVKRLCYALEHGYVQPRNFYGVGGMKIFRDLIWVMRGLMKADHDYYKKHGVYDFPQKKRRQMLMMCFLGAVVRNPKIKSKMGNRMNEGMLAPYKKAIEEEDR